MIILNLAAAVLALQLVAGPADSWQIALPGSAIVAQTGTPRPPGWRVSGTEGEGARLREGPSTRAATLRTLAEGTLVDPVGGPVVNDGLSWSQVRTRSNDLGWVADMLLEPPAGYTPNAAPAAAESAAPLPTAGDYVIGETDGTGANFRTAAGTGASVISVLPDGTVVEPLDETSTVDGRAWRKIRVNGREGWVVAVVVRPR